MIPIGGNFKGVSHQADSLQIYRKQFLSFKDFKAFFVLLTWDILDIASERDGIGGDFKWELYYVG